MQMKEDNGYHFILVIVDLYTKYCWCIALKNKTGKLVKESLQSLFEQTKRIPKRIHVDFGKEFWNKDVQDYLTSVGCYLYKTENLNKSACCERLIKSLRNKLALKLTEAELKKIEN